MKKLFGDLQQPRDGKSLGKMIKDEIGSTGGYAAMIGTLAIIIILISVLGLIVVKALMHSPWGSFTVLMTIPIAMLVGIYLYKIRPGGVLEASIAGVALFLLAVYGGEFIQHSPTLAPFFNRDGKFIAISIIVYGFAAATLPVWLLLTPRDYLSSFLKVGTILLLAIAIFIFRPELQMPAITPFVAGNGPIFSGKIFPFLFITIACGAISGFHALVASGTTPKMISDERDVRMIGYGSMLIESFVAIMAIIAASILDPGVFFAINGSNISQCGNAAEIVSTWGFPITREKMDLLAWQMGESSLFGRAGGAPSLAVGMATIFSSAFGGIGFGGVGKGQRFMMTMWYHFAIMFEAVFILTTLDAGTRVARFMLEDLLKFRDKKLHESTIAAIFSSFVIVGLWGYFLYMGVLDPNGGINILWPLFGMSNQMLAGIALTLATVLILKSERKKWFFIAAIPLAFILTTTTWAVIEKVFSSDVTLGFLAKAQDLKSQIDSKLIFEETSVALTKRTIFNNRLVAAIALGFLTILWVVVIDAAGAVANPQTISS